MERGVLEQEITDFLVIASEFSDYPDASMLWCRKATECLVHALYHDKKGSFPIPDDEGKYPSFFNVFQLVKEYLSRQNKEVLVSINAQTRPSMHWSSDTAGNNAVKFHHVEPIISSIVSIYKDIFGTTLHIKGAYDANKGSIETKIKNSISNQLQEAGINPKKPDVNDKLYSPEEELELKEILKSVDVAGKKDIHFEAWDHISIANASLRLGDEEVSKWHYDEALRLFTEQDDDIGIEAVMWGLSTLSSRKGELKKSEELVFKGMMSAVERGDLLHQTYWVNKLGNVFFQQSDYVEAENMFQDNLKFCRENFRIHEARALGGLALIAEKKGRYTEAKSYHRKALEIFRLIGDQSNESMAILNLANIAWWEKNLQEAYDLYSKANQINELMGYSHLQKSPLTGLGNIAEERGDLVLAEHYFRKSLELSLQFNARTGIGTSLANLGNLLRIRGEFEEAEKMLLEACEILHQKQFWSGLVFVFSSLIRIYDAADESDKVEKYRNDIATIYDKLNISHTDWECDD
jgi:tetratricopeptide (TPR) repeat protein